MTYSSEPKILLLEHPNKKPYTLRQSYNEIMKYCGYTTDIMKGFDLLLDIAKRNNIKNEEIADLTILSDMGFDMQISSYNYNTLSYSNVENIWNTTQDNIENKYKMNGYTTPQIYYVNLAKNASHIQATKERKGVSQFNTYSANLFKYIMTGNLVLDTQKSTGNQTEEEKEKEINRRRF